MVRMGTYPELFTALLAFVRTPLSTLYLCTFLQPLLQTLAQEFPDLDIFAFIDDASFASSDPQILCKAFERFQDLPENRRISLAHGKCVCFKGRNNIPIPEALENKGILPQEQATKVLRAYVGSDQTGSGKLIEKLEKHKTIFRRLEIMGANNISMRLLSKYVNVRHNYHMQVHRPHASQELEHQKL